MIQVGSDLQARVLRKAVAVQVEMEPLCAQDGAEALAHAIPRDYADASPFPHRLAAVSEQTKDGIVEQHSTRGFNAGH